MEGAKRAVTTCLGVKGGEKVVVVTDSTRETIADALFEATLEADAEAIVVKMAPTERDGMEPPAGVAKVMTVADVIFAPTKHSISHTRARREACRMGARVATMPGITVEMMSSGGMTADFAEIRNRVRRLSRALKGAKSAHLETEAGTDLKLNLNRRQWIDEDTGICRRKGCFTNLPAGEIFIAPIEDVAEGTLVVDGSLGTVLHKPAVIEVKKGKAVEVEGAPEIVEQMDRIGLKARTVAELGIGLNDAATIIGNILEDEKSLGTVHVGFGENYSFGGRVRCPFHIDAIMKSASLTVDDKPVLDNGELLE
jgi:leucyl aminopeptidase (aminopeptidase T)